MKELTTKFLRKKLWTKYFSPYIRQKEKGVCFTCLTQKPWKEMQAGHFVHQDCLDFNEENVRCQCPRCNKWLSGNLIIYAIKLEKKYGYGIVQKLKALGDKSKHWKIQELLDLIETYKKKLNSLPNI